MSEDLELTSKSGGQRSFLALALIAWSLQVPASISPFLGESGKLGDPSSDVDRGSPATPSLAAFNKYNTPLQHHLVRDTPFSNLGLMVSWGLSFSWLLAARAGQFYYFSLDMPDLDENKT